MSNQKFKTKAETMDSDIRFSRKMETKGGNIEDLIIELILDYHIYSGSVPRILKADDVVQVLSISAFISRLDVFMQDHMYRL